MLVKKAKTSSLASPSPIRETIRSKRKGRPRSGSANCPRTNRTMRGKSFLQLVGTM
jgi:hypothetical protein